MIPSIKMAPSTKSSLTGYFLNKLTILEIVRETGTIYTNIATAIKINPIINRPYLKLSISYIKNPKAFEFCF